MIFYKVTWPKDSKQKHWHLNVECHWYEWKFLFFWGSVSFLMLKMQRVGVSLSICHRNKLWWWLMQTGLKKIPKITSSVPKLLHVIFSSEVPIHQIYGRPVQTVSADAPKIIQWCFFWDFKLAFVQAKLGHVPLRMKCKNFADFSSSTVVRSKVQLIQMCLARISTF